MLTSVPAQTITSSGSNLKWPYENAALLPDPAVYWNTLENGFRYAILPHNEPPNRISMRLLVEAGSLNETEEQRGVAHFLEHMAFNGTTHFPAGEMVEYFQRLGMAFGADTNAHTSFHETVYKLELPNKEESVLRDSLQLLRDYGDGMLFLEKEINRERGVIMAEMRSRDSVDYRTYQAEMEFIFPESRLSTRFPIGVEEVVKNASRDEFVSFYKDWYTVDRMALIVVGNITPAELDPMIKEYFGSLPAVESPKPNPDIGKVGKRGLVAHLHREPEASETTVSIQTGTDYTLGPDSVDKRIERTKRILATRMLSLRLEILRKKEGSPFNKGSAYSYDWLDFMDMAGIELTTRPENWREALKVAEQELRKALEHGFTEAEFAMAKANLLREFQNVADSAETRHSRDLASDMARKISNGEVFTSPEQNLELLQDVFESLTVQDVEQSFRNLWNNENTYLFVSGDISDDTTEQNLLTAYAESREVEVTPPEEAEQTAFAYSDFGPAGEILTQKRVKSIDATQLHFANNLRLNLKKTDFEKEKIHVYLRVGGGKLDVPAEKPELGQMAQYTLKAGGLEAHSYDDLIRLTAGKNVDINFSVSDDAFVFSGVTNQNDLQFQLQLISAYLIAPGFREEAQRQARKVFDRLYFRLRHTPEGVLQNEVDKLLASEDPRFGYPSEQAAKEVTLHEVAEWLRPILNGAYAELTIVGDFDEEVAIEAVANSLGALPPRDKNKPDYKEARKVSFPRDREEADFTYRTDVPKAVAAVYWPTEDIWDIKLTRRLSMLSQVLDERLRKKIREEMGSAYSPYAVSRPSDVWDGFGYIYSIVIVDPEQVKDITAAVEQLGVAIAEEGISEDELNRLVKPMMNSLEVWVRDNRYWTQTVLGSSQEYPQRLKWAESIIEDYASITAEDLIELAKEYLTPEKGLRVHVIPVELKAPLTPPSE